MFTNSCSARLLLSFPTNYLNLSVQKPTVDSFSATTFIQNVYWNQCNAETHTCTEKVCMCINIKHCNRKIADSFNC